MKPRIAKTRIATAALLVAVLHTNSLFAQQTDSTPASLGGVSTASDAPPPAVVVARDNSPMENNRNGFFGFGFGTYNLKLGKPAISGDTISDDYSTAVMVAGVAFDGSSKTLYGSTFGGGFSILPGKVGQVRFDFDLGIYYWGKGFSNPTDPTDDTWDEYILAIPLLCNVGYEFNLGTPHLRARAGVVFGATTLVFYEGYSDTVSSSTGFTYGGDIGLTYTPGKSFYLDLNYRPLRNSTAKLKAGDTNTYTFAMKSTATELRFSIGWRF